METVKLDGCKYWLYHLLAVDPSVATWPLYCIIHKAEVETA